MTRRIQSVGVGSAGVTTQTVPHQVRRLALGLTVLMSLALAAPAGAQAACSTTASSYAQAVSGTSGLVSYWRLGESSGTAACDETGSNPGSYNSGTTLGVPGAIAGDSNSAVGFDGASGWVSAPASSSLNVGDQFTIEAWVKRADHGTGGNEVVASKQDNSWVLMFNGADQLTLRQSTVADVASSTSTVTDTNWHYVVATKSGSAVHLYIDGSDVTGPVSNQTMADNTQPLAIGQSTGVAYFNGDIDEVALYRSVLSPSQISSHYGLATSSAPPPANDFSLGANPSSLSLAAGASGSSAISTAVTSGSAQSVSLAASGAPSGATVSFSPSSLTAGGSSTMTVNAGTAAAGTYTITVTGTGASATHSTSVSLTVTQSAPPPSSGIVNGGFEARSLSGWTASGASTSVLSSGCHGGTYCARAGSTSPTNGDSSIAQTFTAPSGAGTVSLWYRVVCPDTVTYDWALATLSDSTAGTSTTLVPKTCTNSGTWAQASGPVIAGHSYTLTLTSHDDNYGADPTYTLYDDVTLNAAPTGGGSDPAIVTAGDIACSPSDPNFMSGNGNANGCRELSTSNLMAGGSILGSPIAAVLPLGDEQYDNGTLSEFNGSYAPTWGQYLAISHPVPGNHEYYTSGASGYFGFFDGVGRSTGPAGNPTQGYYSYSIGAWHVIALNSNCAAISGGCGKGSPEETWLQSDLATNSSTCTLAYWHHPLFHSGVETGGALMQQMFTDLYNANTDVVLNGHEHQYERFAPQTPSGALQTNGGIREFIVGTGGKSLEGFGTPAANSEVRDDTTYGDLRLVLHPTSYDWQFIPASGGSFTDGGTSSCHTSHSGPTGTSRDLGRPRRASGRQLRPIDGPPDPGPGGLHPHRGGHKHHHRHRG